MDEATTAAAGKLAEALAKAQGVMQAAEKDRQNPHFKQSYATLASIWEACRKPLSDNGIAVVQRVQSTNAQGVTVVTTLMHASGESMHDSLWMPVTKADAQGFGSAITYARRYGLAAMVGVAPDDDDGNAATAVGAPPAPSGVEKLRAQATSSAAPAGDPGRPAPVTFRFGKSQGKTSHEVDDDTLAWYVAAAKKSAEDPTKAQYAAANTRELAVLQSEQRWRAVGSA